jgi:hypothetical protein
MQDEYPSRVGASVPTPALGETEDQAQRYKDPFPGLSAQLALAGWASWRSDPDMPPVRYFVARWGRVEVLADIDDLQRFFLNVTGQKEPRDGGGVRAG